MTEFAAQLDKLIEVIRLQQQSLERLIHILEKAETQTAKAPAAAPSKGADPGPVDWLVLSGRERLETWRELAAFVARLVDRYGLQLEILPCWWQHNVAVDELTALWQFRRATFRRGADPKAPMGWQDAVNRSRDRMRPVFVSCREGHVDTTMKVWMRDDVQAAFDRAVAEDVIEHSGGQ
ncbi:hypothetical protein [Actinomadura chibensis]|uniref:hypothetical protein n=1 Tax=Actinomadura chibensis TaxID=392828 RepID=UPI0008326E8B|nr:hypothetical protein [Actinomadura chibensis]